MNGARSRIDFHPAADRDIDEALDWYEARSEQATQLFEEALENTLEEIRQDPEIGRPIRSVARVRKLRRFLYRVIYVDREKLDLIYVLALPHDSQKAEFWIDRLADAPEDPSDDQDEP